MENNEQHSQTDEEEEVHYIEAFDDEDHVEDLEDRRSACCGYTTACCGEETSG